MFGNIRMTFGQHLENIRKSSGNGRKSSENRHLVISMRYRVEHSKINFISPRSHVFNKYIMSHRVFPYDPCGKRQNNMTKNLDGHCGSSSHLVPPPPPPPPLHQK